MPVPENVGPETTYDMDKSLNELKRRVTQLEIDLEENAKGDIE